MNDFLGQLQGLAGSAAQAFIDREVGRVQTRVAQQTGTTPGAVAGLPKWALPAIIVAVVLLIVAVVLMRR